MTLLNEKELSYEGTPPLPPISLFDFDEGRFAKDAETTGVTFNVDDTVDFLTEHDEHDRIPGPIALGVYRFDGKYGQENPKLLATPGFFTAAGKCYKDDQPLPMPIVMNIGFQNEADTNATFRHEIFHYLYGDQAPNRLYQREEVKLATRLGGLAASLTSLSSLPTLFNKSWLYAEKVIEHTSPGVLIGSFLGVAATSLYGAAIARNPHQFLHRLDKEERDANAFAKKYQDFNPISIKKGS
jgi:hypothetical protein